MIVLVCGGRGYSDLNKVFKTMNDFLEEKGAIDAIIHGGAKGADALAAEWAKHHRIMAVEFKADWNKHGKAAGPIRNQAMIDKGKPNIVIAFPGGSGTADMVNRAKAAGIEVIEVMPDPLTSPPSPALPPRQP